MNTVDVLVVGAGPAGSAAAAVLAHAGMRVRLIDRARFPRRKLCGDTLNPGTLALLAELDRNGIAADVHHRIQAGALPITGMIVSGPDGTHITADYPDGVGGLALSRSRLDVLLLEAAAAAGADVVQGVRAVAPVVERGRVRGIDVQACTTDVWRASHLVIADGRGSRLAASLQLSRFADAPRRWAFGAYFSGVTGVGGRGEMHLRRDSYVGLAPLPGGLTNVCVVRSLRLRQAPARLDQRAIILATIQKDPSLAVRFTSARQESDVSALGPLAIDSSAAGCPGAVLAGDVAGFVDPMTGDGLRFAIGGGVLAAEAILAEAGSGQSAVATLERARARAFAGKYRFNRALRTLSGSPRALTAMGWLSARWSTPAEAIVRTAGDIRRAQITAVLGTHTTRPAHSRAW